MTRRSSFEQTEIRSETFRLRFDLLIDDPPPESRTTAPPRSRLPNREAETMVSRASGAVGGEVLS